jgi:hypothetical protein
MRAEKLMVAIVGFRSGQHSPLLAPRNNGGAARFRSLAEHCETQWAAVYRRGQRSSPVRMPPDIATPSLPSCRAQKGVALEGWHGANTAPADEAHGCKSDEEERHLAHDAKNRHDQGPRRHAVG